MTTEPEQDDTPEMSDILNELEEIFPGTDDISRRVKVRELLYKAYEAGLGPEMVSTLKGD
jgi:hypothetical protein